VKQTSIWEYIWVGTSLRYLQDQQAGMTVKAEWGTVDNLNSFLNTLDTLGLHVTKRASYDLQDLHKEFKSKTPDYKLTKDDADRIKKAAGKVRDTFQAETEGVFTYVVTDKRIDVKKLLSNAGLLFSPGVFDACLDVARYDFMEAGKCIAFERPTAAAFHILRGTESVVRMFYKRYIRPAQTGLAWGQMTHALATKPSGKKPAIVILQNLDHIRINFRNPTQHPDKIYDIQEAQDLFSLCIDSVNRMIASINKKP
jgi:hypothetical protein